LAVELLAVAVADAHGALPRQLVDVLPARLAHVLSRKLLTVHEDLILYDLDLVAGHADDALDVVRRGVTGVAKDDHLAAPGLPEARDPEVGEGDLQTVDK